MRLNIQRGNARRKQNPNGSSERNTNAPTKADLEQILDSIQELADDALDPELSREDVVAKVKQIYELASGEDSDAYEEDESENDD